MREIPPKGATERDRDHAINQLIRGRSNASGEVTLTAGVTSTTVTGPLINENAGVWLFPKTANAAAEMGAGGLYAVVSAGQFVVTHANNAQTDRTFYYIVLGG